MAAKKSEVKDHTMDKEDDDDDDDEDMVVGLVLFKIFFPFKNFLQLSRTCGT